jgi:hypothetical protein
MSKWTAALVAASSGLLGSMVATATDSPAAAAVLPPMRFSSDKIGEGLFEQLHQAPRFQKLSREVIGSPIELRVYHTFQLTNGGRVSGAVSGMLAAGTLGLLPQVYSGEHAMIYEVLVNGAVLSTHTYHKAIARAHNLWNQDNSAGLGKDGLAWAASTVEQFLSDSATDPKLTELTAEYVYYFGTNSPPTP